MSSVLPYMQICQSGNPTILIKKSVAGTPSLQIVKKFLGEPERPTTDPNIWGWYYSDKDVYYDSGSNQIYNTGSGHVVWKDQTGQAHDLQNSSTRHYALRQPNDLNNHDTLRFSASFGNPLDLGSQFSFLSSVDMLNTHTIYMLIKTINPFQNNGIIYETSDVTFNQASRLAETLPSPNITLTGNSDGPSTSALTGNQWHVLTFILNGASSMICVDKGTDQTGNTAESRVPRTILFGGNAISEFVANFDVASIIISSGSNDATQRAKHVNWLSWYGGLGL